MIFVDPVFEINKITPLSLILSHSDESLYNTVKKWAEDRLLMDNLYNQKKTLLSQNKQITKSKDEQLNTKIEENIEKINQIKKKIDNLFESLKQNGKVNPSGMCMNVECGCRNCDTCVWGHYPEEALPFTIARQLGKLLKTNKMNYLLATQIEKIIYYHQVTYLNQIRDINDKNVESVLLNLLA